MTNIPRQNFTAHNQAEGQLATGTISTGLQFTLLPGEGAEFPQALSNVTTSLGTSTTLNMLNVGISGVSVGQKIRNVTDGSEATILTVNTNDLETTVLSGGTNNVWDNADRWSVLRFEATLERRVNNLVTLRENVYIEEVTGDTLKCHISGNRGKNDTTAQNWNTNDYLVQNDSQGYFNGLHAETRHLDANKAGMIEPRKVSFPGGLGDLPAPTLNNDAARKIDVDSVAAVGAFELAATVQENSMPITLTWNDVIGSGSYEVQRNTGGGFVAIATLSENINTYVDFDYHTGSVKYLIKAEDGNNIIKFSNEVDVSNTNNNTFTGNNFGAGESLIYNDNGNLARGRYYLFPSFNLNTSMDFTGDGPVHIFLTGDLTIGSSAVINVQSGSILSGAPNAVNIQAHNINIAANAGAGGTGGNGGDSGVGCSFGTNGGAAGSSGGNAVNFGGGPGFQGFGGTSGGNTWDGGGAGAGDNIRVISGCSVAGVSPDGGDGGSLANFSADINFFVGGATTIAAGAQFIANGPAGVNGQDGTDGVVSVVIGQYSSGGSGGGAGSGGADAGNLNIFNKGTFTDSGMVVTAIGGAAGLGGTGGLGATHPGGGLSSAGTNGGNGTAGASGALNNYQLT